MVVDFFEDEEEDDEDEEEEELDFLALAASAAARFLRAASRAAASAFKAFSILASVLEFLVPFLFFESISAAIFSSDFSMALLIFSTSDSCLR